MYQRSAASWESKIWSHIPGPPSSRLPLRRQLGSAELHLSLESPVHSNRASVPTALLTLVPSVLDAEGEVSAPCGQGGCGGARTNAGPVARAPWAQHSNTWDAQSPRPSLLGGRLSDPSLTLNPLRCPIPHLKATPQTCIQMQPPGSATRLALPPPAPRPQRGGAFTPPRLCPHLSAHGCSVPPFQHINVLGHVTSTDAKVPFFSWPR